MIKVFLVEDESLIREAILKMVPWNEYGFEVVGEAQDGEVALPMIRELKPDVLITDIKMPFMDGLALSKRVRKELPATKIIIVSGHDDFQYAQQAINIGVEQYLLKPITKNVFIEVLQGIRDKFQQEGEQKVYYEQFRREIQEYEKNSRRDFFEKMVSGVWGLEELYERAESLSLDIAASEYNIILFTIESSRGDFLLENEYSQSIANIQEQIDVLFSQMEHCLLFRYQQFSYAVLVKGAVSGMAAKNMKNCINALEKIFREEAQLQGWFICTGKQVERLSQLPESYNEAMRIFGFRFNQGMQVVQYGEEMHFSGREQEVLNLRDLNMNAVDPEIIRNFLSNALADEVDTFAENYVQMLGESALKSKMFRQYVLLNVHINAISFAMSLGFDKDEMEDSLSTVCSSLSDSMEESIEVIAKTLRWAIELRDNNVQKKQHSMIKTAIAFIQEHYGDEDLNLNKVACAANVSANHFSALFSQEMEQTFIEYVTNVRMQKAKELLRCSDMRSGEIATEVGYKDSHYFSFLFKKTQGCTPSEYRNGKGKEI